MFYKSQNHYVKIYLASSGTGIPYIIDTAVVQGGYGMFMMPGRSHKGALPPLTACESELAGRLAEHVEMLAGTIGERNVVHYSALRKAAAYITGMFVELGFAPREELYMAEGREVENIEAQLKGTSEPEEIVVIGAHYDSVSGSPGADDNASGVAA